MDDKIMAIFVIVSDLLRAMGHKEDPQRRMTDAEVITTALVAMLFHLPVCDNYRIRHLHKIQPCEVYDSFRFGLQPAAHYGEEKSSQCTQVDRDCE